MNVTELANEGLKREYRINVPADAIDAHLSARLKEVGRSVKLPGFRPGKVPMKVLRQRFGKSVMGEVLEKTVEETSQQAIAESGLRVAARPKIEVSNFEDGGELEYTMSLEVLPPFELIDFAALELERLVTPVTDDSVEEALVKVAEAQPGFDPVDPPRPAEMGDQVTIDFDGKVDGEARDGMKAEDHNLVLGSNAFIEGFESQLVGMAVDETRDITVTFPDTYGEESLQGKEAVFTVTTKAIAAPQPAAVDEALAERMGQPDLDTLRQSMRTTMERRYSGASRQRLKRTLLDKLAESYDFDVPQTLLDAEFGAIWQRVEEALKAGTADAAEAEKPEEELKAEYRQIAERRVRLGLVLAEAGRENHIEVSQEELQRGIINEAMKYRGQEKEVLELFRNNPQAAESVRAPLLEEKVVDYIVELATITDREVSAEELFADPDADPSTAPAEEPAG